MPYIYRYFDKNDSLYKYIGISSSLKNFNNRIKNHKCDPWWNKGDWIVTYAYVKSKSDVEMLEGHYIAELKTYKWYNKAKRYWGKSALSKDFNLDWKEYTQAKKVTIKSCRDIEVLREIASSKQSELESCKRKLRVEKQKNKRLSSDLLQAEKEIRDANGDRSLLQSKNESLSIENRILDSLNKSLKRTEEKGRVGVDYSQKELIDLAVSVRRANEKEVCKLFHEDFFNKVVQGNIDMAKVGDKRQQDAFMQGIDYACDNLIKIFSERCYI